jgi:hypothetical protein
MRSQVVALTFIVILVSAAGFGPSVAGAQAWCPDLAGKVERGELGAISFCKLSWERGWDQSWVLKHARIGEISDFISGIILNWERNEADTVRSRTDSFESSGQFYTAHESFVRAGREIARGPVFLTSGGEPRYRILVNLTGDHPPGWNNPDNPLDMSDVLSYELSVYKAGRIVAAYESSSNFLVDGRTLKLKHVPSDARLKFGSPVREVERIREGHGN